MKSSTLQYLKSALPLYLCDSVNSHVKLITVCCANSHSMLCIERKLCELRIKLKCRHGAVSHVVGVELIIV